MLTRLLLKASDKAPWSDNGDAKNPALSPLGENVKTKGQYFYQLALDGNVAGKEKQALIDQFRAKMIRIVLILPALVTMENRILVVLLCECLFQHCLYLF